MAKMTKFQKKVLKHLNEIEANQIDNQTLLLRLTLYVLTHNKENKKKILNVLKRLLKDRNEVRKEIIGKLYRKAVKNYYDAKKAASERMPTPELANIYFKSADEINKFEHKYGDSFGFHPADVFNDLFADVPEPRDPQDNKLNYLGDGLETPFYLKCLKNFAKILKKHMKIIKL